MSACLAYPIREGSTVMVEDEARELSEEDVDRISA